MTQKRFVELAKLAYDVNEANGWHEQGRNYQMLRALAITEIAEAIECLRAGEPQWHYNDDGKPEGFVSEEADFVIRIMDTLGELLTDQGMSQLAQLAMRVVNGVTFVSNTDAPLEFVQMSFYDHIMEICYHGVGLSEPDPEDPSDATIFNLLVASLVLIKHREQTLPDFDTHIEAKIEYNRTRGYKHGGKVV